MNSNIKEKLEKGNWFVTCENEDEYNKLLSACSEVGLKWLNGSDLDDCEIIKFPVYVGVDNDNVNNNSISRLLYSYIIDVWGENELNKNITKLFFDKSNETDASTQSSDRSNEIITLMNSESWCVKCKNAQQVELLLNICKKLGLRWDINRSATQFNPQDYEDLPIYIGVDQKFNKEIEDPIQSLCYASGDYEFSYDKCVTDITEEFFKIFDSSPYLTLLINAILENKVVYLKDSNNKWFKPDFTQYKICDNSINNQISTPLNITREMWNLIDPIYKYAAMDEDGDIYFYEYEPIPDPEYLEGVEDEFTWRNSNSAGTYQLSIFNIDTSDIIPANSLTKRPEV